MPKVTLHPAAPSHLYDDVDDADLEQHIRDLSDLARDAEPFFRALESGECPIYPSIPANLCANCADRHPCHFPLGISRPLRDIMQKRPLRVRDFLKALLRSIREHRLISGRPAAG